MPLRSSRERPRQGVGLGPSSSGGFGNYPSSSGASAAGSGSWLPGSFTKSGALAAPTRSVSPPELLLTVIWTASISTGFGCNGPHCCNQKAGASWGQ